MGRKVTKHPNLKGQNTFLKGCSKRKISAVTDHEHSQMHTKAVEQKNVKTSTVEESKAAKVLRSLKENERYRLNILFRNAHAVIKNNRPFTDFDWLCSLDKVKGIDIGETYLNRKAALQFGMGIASSLRSDTQNMLKKAPFF